MKILDIDTIIKTVTTSLMKVAKSKDDALDTKVSDSIEDVKFTLTEIQNKYNSKI